MHAFLHTQHHVIVVSLCTSYYNGSVSSLWHLSTSISVVLMLSTSPGFYLVVHKAMLPRTHILANAILCTELASHANAPGPPQGSTYLPLGHTLSILASTNNGGNAHNAWVSTLPHTLHHHLLILGLVLSAGHGVFLTMPCWRRDVPSSLVAVII